jgi:hypothetical protein
MFPTQIIARTHNSTYPKVAVQWLNEALCFYQSLCLVASEVLRNRHLRVAANRVCLESTRESGKNAVQKMEDLKR